MIYDIEVLKQYVESVSNILTNTDKIDVLKLKELNDKLNIWLNDIS